MESDMTKPPASTDCLNRFYHFDTASHFYVVVIL